MDESTVKLIHDDRMRQFYRDADADRLVMEARGKPRDRSSFSRALAAGSA